MLHSTTQQVNGQSPGGADIIQRKPDKKVP